MRITVVLAFALVLLGCQDTEDLDGGAGTAVTPRASPNAGAVDTARRDLATLRRAPRGFTGPDYSRDAFGQAWADVDGNGCNQRDDVLVRDARLGTVRVQQQGACTHDVLAGTWADPYSGKTMRFDDLKDLTQAQAIQIDHVVPLAEAWASGAAAWSPQRRERFANDLAVLVAADGPTNMSKGADDPAAWRPSTGYQCAYAVRWVAVKTRWHLTVDPPEVRAVHEMLGSCEA